jgi:hypothetical protein
MNLTIAESLESELPLIISQIARSKGIEDYNNPYFSDPRLKKWHQYGILKHSKKVREAYLGEANDFLRQWGFYSKVEDYFKSKIGNRTKKELFEISIPLHDLGKILCLGVLGEDRAHESQSVALMREDEIKGILTNYGLAAQQQEYLAGCVENHEIIAKQVRRDLRHKKKFELEYVVGEEVKQICLSVLENNSFKVEAGLFFLCDTLGKTEIRSMEEFAKYFRQKNLNSELQNAVRQFPISLELAKIYLSLAL